MTSFTNTIIGVGPICDANCTVVFNKKDVTVLFPEDKTILTGLRAKRHILGSFFSLQPVRIVLPSGESTVTSFFVKTTVHLLFWGGVGYPPFRVIFLVWIWLVPFLCLYMCMSFSLLIALLASIGPCAPWLFLLHVDNTFLHWSMSVLAMSQNSLF